MRTMIYLSTSELYGMFLQSDFWTDLARRNKLASRNRCVRCGSAAGLQSHHRVYRENWFDTRLEDLECLCRDCHERAHDIHLTPRLNAIGEMILAGREVNDEDRSFLAKTAASKIVDASEVRRAGRLLTLECSNRMRRMPERPVTPRPAKHGLSLEQQASYELLMDRGRL